MAHHKKEEHHKEHREKHEKYARGGRADHGGKDGSESKSDIKRADDYSGTGKPNVVKEALSRENKFRRGGKIMGKKSKSRMDKFARGGRAGCSPFSSAKVHTNGDA